MKSNEILDFSLSAQEVKISTEPEFRTEPESSEQKRDFSKEQDTYFTPDFSRQSVGWSFVEVGHFLDLIPGEQSKVLLMERRQNLKRTIELGEPDFPTEPKIRELL